MLAIEAREVSRNLVCKKNSGFRVYIERREDGSNFDPLDMLVDIGHSLTDVF